MESGKFSSEEFEKKLASFETYIVQITQRDTEINIEERRKKILGNVHFIFEFFLFVIDNIGLKNRIDKIQ